MFSHFCKKIKNSKWPPFLKIFWKVGIVYFLDTLWVENFDEIALSLTVKEIAKIMCFRIFAKIRKFKMAAIFENCLESGYSIFLRYPGGRKFRRNRSISYG